MKFKTDQRSISQISQEVRNADDGNKETENIGFDRIAPILSCDRGKGVQTTGADGIPRELTTTNASVNSHIMNATEMAFASELANKPKNTSLIKSLVSSQFQPKTRSQTVLLQLLHEFPKLI